MFPRKVQVVLIAILAALSYCISLTHLILATLSTVLSYGIYRYYEFVSHYPKGPFPLPFLGNILKIDPRRIDKTFEREGKANPPVYTFFMPFPCVQITDYDILKEAFMVRGDEFAGRPDNVVYQEVFSFAHNSGVINSNGDVWREQRRAAISIMRDFGMGKNVMEEQIRSSISDYLAHLESIPDKSNVDLYWPIQVAVSNVINEVLFGYRHKFDDCKPLMNYITRFNQLMEEVCASPAITLAMTFPSLTKLPWIGWHILGRIKHEMHEINQYVVDNVNKVLKDYSVDDEPTCFAHAYKQRMEENNNLDDVNLMSSCVDFFIAGQETTATTLRWSMLIMAKHQEIQEKLRQEILDVVGTDRLPSMADQTKMPYTRACIHEMQRFANVFGMNVQHVTRNDVEIRGYKIPSGTWINGDIHYLMANDPVFVNSQEFRPERYLTEDGANLEKDLVERTVPFSLGKRVCAGEALARVEIFLALSATVQHYRILPREGETIDLEPAMLTTFIMPKPQRLRLEKVI